MTNPTTQTDDSQDNRHQDDRTQISTEHIPAAAQRRKDTQILQDDGILCLTDDHAEQRQQHGNQQAKTTNESGTCPGSQWRPHRCHCWQRSLRQPASCNQSGNDNQNWHGNNQRNAKDPPKVRHAFTEELTEDQPFRTCIGVWNVPRIKPILPMVPRKIITAQISKSRIHPATMNAVIFS